MGMDVERTGAAPARVAVAFDSRVEGGGGSHETKVRRRRWTKRRSLLAAACPVVLVLGLSPALASPAGASEPVVPVLEDHIHGIASVPLVERDGQLEATSSKATTIIRDRTVISVDLDSGSEVTITPTGDGSSWAREDSGAALSTGPVDYIAQPDATGVAIMGVLDRASVPVLSFDLEVSDGLTLMLDQEDGSIDIVGPDGVALGAIESPWALDAAGRAVPTHYTLARRRLTQHVDLAAATAFPVVADPKVTWGLISGTVYFSKLETRDISGMATMAALCLFMGLVPKVGSVLAATCASHWALWIAVATIAKNRNECVKIKYGSGYTTPQMQRYTGGYCGSGK